MKYIFLIFIALCFFCNIMFSQNLLPDTNPNKTTVNQNGTGLKNYNAPVNDYSKNYFITNNFKTFDTGSDNKSYNIILKFKKLDRNTNLSEIGSEYERVLANKEVLNKRLEELINLYIKRADDCADSNALLAIKYLHKSNNIVLENKYDESYSVFIYSKIAKYYVGINRDSTLKYINQSRIFLDSSKNKDIIQAYTYQILAYAYKSMNDTFSELQCDSIALNIGKLTYNSELDLYDFYREYGYDRLGYNTKDSIGLIYLEIALNMSIEHNALNQSVIDLSIYIADLYQINKMYKKAIIHDVFTKKKLIKSSDFMSNVKCDLNIATSYYYLQEYDSSISYCKRNVKLLNNTNEYFYVALFNELNGWNYYRKTDYDTSIYYFEKALLEYKNNNKDILRLGSTYYILSECYERIANYNKSIDYSYKYINLEIKKSKVDTSAMVKIYESLGFNYLQKGKFAKAISCLDSVFLYNDTLISNQFSNHYWNRGMSLYNLKLYDSAYFDLKKTLMYLEKNINTKLESDTNGYIRFYWYMGNLYNSLYKLDSASIYYQKSLNLTKLTKYSDTLNYIDCYYNLLNSYVYSRKNREAEHTLKILVPLLNHKTSDSCFMMNLYSTLVDFYMHQDNTDSTISYLIKYTKLDDIICNTDYRRLYSREMLANIFFKVHNFNAYRFWSEQFENIYNKIEHKEDYAFLKLSVDVMNPLIYLANNQPDLAISGSNSLLNSYEYQILKDSNWQDNFSLILNTIIASSYDLKNNLSMAGIYWNKVSSQLEKMNNNVFMFSNENIHNDYLKFIHELIYNHYFIKKDYKNALISNEWRLNNCIQLDSNNYQLRSDLYINKANCLLSLKDKVEGFNSIDSALEMILSNDIVDIKYLSQIYSNKAYRYFLDSNYDKAITNYYKAIEYSDGDLVDNHLMYFNIALCYLNLNNITKSFQIIDSIKHNLDNQFYYENTDIRYQQFSKNLIDFYYQQCMFQYILPRNDKKVFEILMNKLVLLYGKDFNNLTYAYYYSINKDYKKAILYTKKAVENNSTTWSCLESVSFLNNIRKKKEFQNIIESLKSKSE